MAEQSQISSYTISPSCIGGSKVGLASVAIAAVAIPLFCVSILRIKTLQTSNPDLCLVQETPFYAAVNTLGPVLSAASVTCGILAMIRCRRRKVRFSACIPALAGIVIALAALIAYFFALLSLAQGHPH